MANLRLVTNNHVDSATLSAAPSSSPNTSINNLKEESRSKVVRLEANSFGSVSLPVSTGGTNIAEAMVISSDNSKVYLLNSTAIYEYNTNDLNGSVVNLTYVNNFSFGSVVNDIFISSDGVYLIVASDASAGLFRYTMSTAWDITTCVFSGFLGIGYWASYLTLSPDGTNVYFGNETLDNVDHWTMSTPWDIASAVDTTNTLDVSSEDILPTGICFNSAGNRLYLSGDSNNTLYQYTLTTPWDISTAIYSIGAGDSLLETTTLATLLETTTGLPLQEVGAGAGINLDISATTTILDNISISVTEDKYVYIVSGSNIYHLGLQVEGDISTGEFLSGGLQSIYAEFIENSNISSVVLGRHNLVKDSIVRIYIYKNSDFTNELYDSGNLIITEEEAGSLTSTWGDFDWGTVPWGTQIDEFAPTKNFVHWINPTIISALSLKILLTVPSNQIEIGRMFIGQYIEPTYNMSFGHNISWRENTKQYRSEEGTLRSDIGMPARRIEFNLDTINANDRSLIQHNFRNVGLRDDFYISLFPEDPDIDKKLDYSGIVKLVQEPKVSEFAPLYYKSKYIMEEV